MCVCVCMCMLKGTLTLETSNKGSSMGPGSCREPTVNATMGTSSAATEKVPAHAHARARTHARTHTSTSSVCCLMSSGHGSLTGTDGHVYQGSFHQDQRHGEGRIQYRLETQKQIWWKYHCILK